MQCRIGLLDNNELRYIICYNNGNLDGVGVTLQLGYTTVEKINALLDLGDIEYLGYNVNAPKTFMYVVQAYRNYKSCEIHFKTTFTLANKRDLQKAGVNYNAHLCNKETIFTSGFTYYFYDVQKQCWFVTANGSEPVRLKNILTDREYFDNCDSDVCKLASWTNVASMYRECKNDLTGKGEYSILGRYNAWLKAKPEATGYEFGYAVRDGKRMYALMKKSEKDSGRRKVIKYSPHISTLVQYVVFSREFTHL